MTIYRYHKWKNTYILVNKGLKKKYSNPFIYGDDLKKILKESILDVLNMLKPSYDNEDMLVIRILEGGRYYYVYEALSNLLYKKPLLGEIDIKSRLIFNPKDVVTKVIKDEGICGKTNDISHIYIGDTVASGKTMLTLFDRLKPCLQEDIEFIIIGFSTFYGLNRIRKWLEKNNYRYIFIVYGALLGLGWNLTDMTIGDKPSYIPLEIREYTEKRLGNEIANKLCVIGDFTYSTKYIEKYIAERVVQLWEIGVNSSLEETKKKAMNLIREGTTLLMKKGLDIEEIKKILAEEYERRLFLIGKEAKISQIPIEKLISLQKLEE